MIMGCGCRKKSGTDARTSTSAGKYQVWRSGSFTGRTFTSLVSAQAYADRIGGEVRES